MADENIYCLLVIIGAWMDGYHNRHPMFLSSQRRASFRKDLLVSLGRTPLDDSACWLSHWFAPTVQPDAPPPASGQQLQGDRRYCLH